MPKRDISLHALYKSPMLRHVLVLLLTLQIALAPMVQAAQGVAVKLSNSDVPFEIGEMVVVRDENGKIISKNKDWEGSLPHILLHGLAGCAAAEATGASCAAGAAGAVAQSLYAGTLDGTDLSDEKQQQNVELIAAVAAFFASGGQAVNVNVGASIGVSALINNRQLHRTEAELIEENASAFAKILGLCGNADPCSAEDIEIAIGVLTMQALSQVDAAFAYAGGNDQAVAFLASLGQGSVIEGTDQTLFFAEGAQYTNGALNSNFLFENQDIYDFATQYGGNAFDNVDDAFITALTHVHQDQNLAPEDAAVFRDELKKLSPEKLGELMFDISYNNGGEPDGVTMAAAHLLLETFSSDPDMMRIMLDATMRASAQLAVDRALVTETFQEIGRKIADGEGLTDDEIWLLATIGGGAALAGGSIKGLGSLVKSPGFARIRRGLGLPSNDATNRGTQIALNRQNGAAFENQVVDALSHVGGTKNGVPVTVTLPSGKQVTTIPDLWGRSTGGILEVKNVQNLSNSNQLRAQLQLAEETGTPFNLVVSPRTQNISGPLRDRIDEVTTKVGGGIYRYDPSTGNLSNF